MKPQCRIIGLLSNTPSEAPRAVSPPPTSPRPLPKPIVSRLTLSHLNSLPRLTSILMARSNSTAPAPTDNPHKSVMPPTAPNVAQAIPRRVIFGPLFFCMDYRQKSGLQQKYLSLRTEVGNSERSDQYCWGQINDRGGCLLSSALGILSIESPRRNP